MSASKWPACRSTEPVLELVETRVGEPLGMRNVRATIDHLVGLGRFEDVRVFAVDRRPGCRPALAADAGPAHQQITVAGNAGPVRATRFAPSCTERFGAQPSANRVDEMVHARSQAFYADARFRERHRSCRGSRTRSRCPSCLSSS